jgi:hypothetical protein
MSTWLVVPSGDKVFDVSKAGRQLRAGVSLTVALRFIKRNRAEGDKVYREEPDGYRVSIR